MQIEPYTSKAKIYSPNVILSYLGPTYVWVRNKSNKFIHFLLYYYAFILFKMFFTYHGLNQN